MRKTGVLLHISSLPGEYGIGDFGTEAYKYADFLKDNGHSIWQILPLNPCGYGNSPYNPLSAYALNPYLISPELLYQNGYVNKAQLQDARLPRSAEVHYELVAKTKDKLLMAAAENWLLNNDPIDYLAKDLRHLKPYLAFTTLSKLYGDTAWSGWNSEHRHYSEALFNRIYAGYKNQLDVSLATQVLLSEQILALRDYLKNKGIMIVGDMPLYLSYESAEVWAYQHCFDLDEQGRRLHFAGVPPDAFASEGQLWGNPLYRWNELQKDGFELFKLRIRQALNFLDVLRLDHFIGYVNFWQVDSQPGPDGEPALPKNALEGRWVDALPREFLGSLIAEFGIERFLAEDLGILNEKVCSLRDGFGFPGMIVLQFCFEESVPEVVNYPSERWLYTCTHDNPTTRGWYETLSPESPSYQNLHEYCKRNRLRDCHTALNTENIHIVMQSIALASPCQRVIFPMQDILGLDNTARMNIPGTALGNWQWRML